MIWSPGETLDIAPGMLFLNAKTGVMEGYLPADREIYDGLHRTSRDGSWVLIRYAQLGNLIDSGYVTFLHDRESGESWRWPADRLKLVGFSRDYILFQTHSDGGDQSDRSIAEFVLVNRALELISRFSTEIADDPDVARRTEVEAVISPDGLTVALLTAPVEEADRVRFVDVQTGAARVVFTATPRDDYVHRVDLEPWRDGRELAITTTYRHMAWRHPPNDHTKIIDWAGSELLNGSCPGRLSPDGRYVARQEGSAIAVRHVGYVRPVQPWASVVIADAMSCEPVLRVRSAYASQSGWSGEWLADSSAFVVGVAPHPETRGRFLLARVSPRAELAHLPGEVVHLPGQGGLVPAPAGDGRYYARGRFGIYDALLDRWLPPAFSADSHFGYWPLRWTSDGEEVAYAFSDPNEGGAYWLLTQPKMELPPFSEEDAFRLVGEGACIELRDIERFLGCLEEGVRVVTRRGFHYHETGRNYWIYVRTEDGREGSVLIENLEWY